MAEFLYLFLYFLRYLLDKLREFHRPQVTFAPLPDRNALGLRLFPSHYQHIRDLRYLSVPDLMLHPGVLVIDLCPYIVIAQFLRDLPGIILMLIGYWYYNSLDRRKPYRECSSVMFYQSSQEPLHRP